MKAIKFDFTNTSHLMCEDCFILWRPIRSILFRTCLIPEELKNNKEFTEVCNTLSVNGKAINGVYYFKIKSHDDFYDLSMTFTHMGIEHLFAEPDVTVGATSNNREILN